jgi:hypothetical protein
VQDLFRVLPLEQLQLRLRDQQKLFRYACLASGVVAIDRFVRGRER